MDFPEYFLSCDWGTTNFRLRVVETRTLAVHQRVTTDQGVRSIYKSLQAASEATQFRHFAAYLLSRIEELPTEYQNYPVVASGMASSNMGILELPYAGLPFDASGESLISQWLDIGKTTRLLLISGILGNDSMMRGEEVQAIGLADRMKQDGILILPGTHSKHLRYVGNHFTAFSTYMTGEIFEVLSHYSILAGSVAAGPFDASGKQAFLEGGRQGRAGMLTGSLFSVRVRDVVHNRSPQENHYFLSGLLIGEEVRQVENEKGAVYLAASGSVLELYRLALEIDPAGERLKVFNGQSLERALLSGQSKILLQYVR